MVDDPITKLVNDYAESIVQQRNAIERGNAKEARYYGNKRSPIARKLLHLGEEGMRQFATLLCHPDRRIRATAAVHLASSMPAEALTVFRELAKGDDLVAAGAQMRIKEWEEHPENYDESNWV